MASEGYGELRLPRSARQPAFGSINVKAGELLASARNLTGASVVIAQVGIYAIFDDAFDL